MSRWHDYGSKGPIDVDGGIRARSGRGDIGKSWWAQRWSQALSRLMDSGRLSRGRTYARRGQVISIEEKGREILAEVQGSRPTPYKVRIELAALPDEAWDRVLDELAEQAIFAAQLLAGEMPQDIEEAFAAAGASLFPAHGRELATECSCPDWANPCKHVAAVHFLLGEAFDDDPFMIFRLRGRTQEEILSGLRARRAGRPGGEVGLEPADEEQAGPTPVPLPTDPAAFWTIAEPLDDLSFDPRPPEVPLSLLRRVGQPEFLEQDVMEVLGPTYLRVSEAAEALAFAEDEVGEGSAGDEWSDPSSAGARDL